MVELRFEETLSQEMMESISNYLKENRKLKSLILENCGIDSEMLGTLLEGLNNNETLEKISLKYNEISEEEDYEKIAQFLSENKTLKELDLSENDFESSWLLPFIDSLRKNSSLVSINTSRNEVHDCFLNPEEDNRSNEELHIEYLLRCNQALDQNVDCSFEPFVDSFACFINCSKIFKLPKPICFKILQFVDRKAFFPQLNSEKIRKRKRESNEEEEDN